MQLEGQPVTPFNSSKGLPYNIRLPCTSSSKIHTLILSIPLCMNTLIKHRLIPSPMFWNFCHFQAFMQFLLCFFKNLPWCISSQQNSSKFTTTEKHLCWLFGTFLTVYDVGVLLWPFWCRSLESWRRSQHLASLRVNQNASVAKLICFTEKIAVLIQVAKSWELKVPRPKATPPQEIRP